MPRLFSRFCSSALVISLSLSLVTIAAHAQRLPQTVKPEHYTLTLTPDLVKATFAGEETIAVEVMEPTDSITLNAAEIKFLSVTAMGAGKTLTAKVTEDKEKQEATFHFDQKLLAGPLKLSVSFQGILNDELRGFYLSKTKTRNYGVTQFEATDARRAFPCFDEPAMKATFAITLVVDRGDTVISNTNIIHDEPLPTNAALHSISFAETPKMSTYLVAFLVGDFKCLSGSSDGVPIRACSTPDQVQYGAFALSAAEYVLHYYDTYFGIKYPMPKLDMIAIPDFQAGAMENFGAITYRETALLLDTDHATVGAQRGVANVVAHEMAHQWFGDMVTMQWWDNIWLNEGFATWMENKPIEAWKPEWKIQQEVASSEQGTMNLDARRVTRTIRAKADTPDEINEMFDGISYGKAGAVLLMVENYLGEETFRQGVHKYLAAHMYGNATAEDFWNAQTEVSHKPVDKIMSSLVVQPGVPILTFGSVANSKVPVTQKRFFLNSNVKSDGLELWELPVCFKTSRAPRCELLSAASGSLAVPAAPYFFADADGKGYYRSIYPDAVYKKLLGAVETDLNPEERISLIGDQWALARAGKTTVGDYLDLVKVVSKDPNPAVLGAAIGRLDAVETRIAATEQERTRLAAWLRATFGPIYKELKPASASDSAEAKEMRATLFGIVAGADDPETIAEAKSMANRSLADPGSVDPTLANVALFVAARNGDAAFFDQLQKQSTTALNPQTRSSALYALAVFKDAVLARRALDYAASGQVRSQDALGLFAFELQSRENQERAWDYIQKNWEKVVAQIPATSQAGLVGSTAGFCSAERLDEVTSFFATHKVPASERTLAQAKDQITDCIDLRAAQEGNLKTWLSKQ